MTSDQAPPDVPYESQAPNAYKWTEEAFDLLVHGHLSASVETKAGIQSALVVGECPHCHHDVNYRQVLDAVTGEALSVIGPRTLPADTEYVPLTVSCRCTEPHAGRPSTIDHGCGINFRVDVRPGS